MYLVDYSYSINLFRSSFLLKVFYGLICYHKMWGGRANFSHLQRNRMKPANNIGSDSYNRIIVPKILLDTNIHTQYTWLEVGI